MVDRILLAVVQEQTLICGIITKRNDKNMSLVSTMRQLPWCFCPHATLSDIVDSSRLEKYFGNICIVSFHLTFKRSVLINN